MADLNKIRIGVVIVNFNSGNYLSLSLKSLSASTAPLDIVIVDNQSSDQSLAQIEGIVDAPHSLELIRNDHNYGFSRAVNIGIAKLENDFIMMLNPDCTVFPSTLLNLQKALVSSPQAAIAGAVVFNPDGSEQRGCRRNEPTLKRSAVTALGLDNRFEGVNMNLQPFPAEPAHVDAVSGAAMMVRRKLFNDIGGMDEDYFLHCEDLDICRKARDLGHSVLFCPKSAVIHYQGSSSNVTSATVERHKHDGMLIYNKNYTKDGAVVQLLTSMLVRGHYIFGLVVTWFKSLYSKYRGGDEGGVDALAGFNALQLTRQDRPLVLVTGGKTDVGDHLIRLLDEKGYKCIAISRNEVPVSAAMTDATWLNLEFFLKFDAQDFGDVCAWINLAPVWTTRSLAKVLHKFQPGKIISMSSTSIVGKADSDNEADMETVSKLVEGEKWIQDYSEKFEIDTTILRPTLIYGGPRNQNINFIKKVIRWFRVFPVIGNGSGKRQPVHAEDLAILCVDVVAHDIKGARSYNAGGGEVLTYREMVDRVFTGMGHKPRFLPVPLALAKKFATLASYLPGLGFLNAEMVQRMQENLVYSNDEVTRDFKFSPRRFEP